MNDKQVKEIAFPNTISDEGKSYYTVGKNGVTEIKQVYQNGEMASIDWFEIYQGEELIAEIKKSICNVYYK